MATWQITRQSVGNFPRETPFRDRLRAALDNIPASAIARSGGVTVKAAERWKAGDNCPSADALARLCADFESVWAEFRAQACRSETDAERILQEFAIRLAERRRDDTA